MAWSKKLTQLNDALGELIPMKESIPKYVKSAGLKQQFIATDGNAVDVWNSVISEAEKNDKINELVNAVLETYPNNPFLITALSKDEVNYSLSPDIDKISEWQPISKDTLEVLTTGESTLLPISFLELGIQRSHAVAKVEIINGLTREVGTGFLFSIKGIDEYFFMTNYHVINDKKKIDKTRIIFNYELDINGNSKASQSFEINDEGPWYTSPAEKLDVSIFKLKATDEVLNRYSPIPLLKSEVMKNDFVNIIQHPGGQMKQISLYHNIVTNTDNRIVQYVTDTLKGSSGSPVFNSSWDVVALHHSGGGKKDDEPALPFGFKSRNEGIQINQIIDFFINNHKI